jgi:hypothetical protein
MPRSREVTMKSIGNPTHPQSPALQLQGLLPGTSGPRVQRRYAHLSYQWCTTAARPLVSDSRGSNGERCGKAEGGERTAQPTTPNPTQLNPFRNTEPKHKRYKRRGNARNTASGGSEAPLWNVMSSLSFATPGRGTHGHHFPAAPTRWRFECAGSQVGYSAAAIGH